MENNRFIDSQFLLSQYLIPHKGKKNQELKVYKNILTNVNTNKEFPYKLIVYASLKIVIRY